MYHYFLTFITIFCKSLYALMISLAGTYNHHGLVIQQPNQKKNRFSGVNVKQLGVQ